MELKNIHSGKKRKSEGPFCTYVIKTLPPQKAIPRAPGWKNTLKRHNIELTSNFGELAFEEPSIFSILSYISAYTDF